MRFVDQARVFVRSGSGGAGAVSFRREKYIEYGGPDGGNGGAGGSVWAEVVPGLNTLVDFRFQRHFRAGNGHKGKRRQRSGANGDDVTLRVPAGTDILDEHRTIRIADLVHPGTRVLLAGGGRGGAGNMHFKTSINQAPRTAQPGQPGTERTLWLRLRLIADVGLIGLPNAGKSTLLACVSNARPRVAAYPFTTLHPNLGSVRLSDGMLIIADLPGLIAGASCGHGLGHRFLGHAERCAALLHVVDGTADDPVTDYHTIVTEIEAYGGAVATLPRVVTLNKVDALDRTTAERQLRRVSHEAQAPVLPLSGANGAGVDRLLRQLANLMQPRIEADHISSDMNGRGTWSPE